MIVELIVLLASIFVFLQFVKGRGGESNSPTLEEAEQKLAKKELEKEKLVKKSTSAQKPTGKSLKKLNQASKKLDHKEFEHGLLTNTLKGHTKCVNDISFSENGKFIATSDGERSILLWPTKELGKGNTSYRYNTAHDPALSVKFAPDGKSLCAILQKENTVALFQVAKQDGGSYELKHISNAVDFLPGAALKRAKIAVQFQSGVQAGSFLYHEYSNHTVVLSDLRGNQELHRFPAASGSNGKTLLSPCSKFVVGFGDSAEIRGWAVLFKSGSYASTKKLHSLCGHKSNVSQAAFFPDSSKLISLSDASGFKIYDFNSADWQRDDTPREAEAFPNQWGAVDSILISPDNLILALVQHSSIKFISLRTKVLVLEIKDIFNGAIKSVEFSPDSELVAVAGDRCVRIFKNLPGLIARAHEAKSKLMNPNCNETYRNRLLAELKSDQKQINELQKQLLSS
ncbi:Oidioi.mRNA.OKI2018_I69.chr2.g5832.t1.cds [Oikopleura dioica]|uniref:Oidioi.mRNA.OKI2018_I69.chr2.g5832.t1.cds n=1 Tax=Oikopleura dioica TaxID=34765 RepID=A0ABN7T228_OIKDI|nr:Oidioi.mRNA.OKI2018_I69.chr2.g5832.t1.cds [Oikopleura dioica]